MNETGEHAESSFAPANHPAAAAETIANNHQAAAAAAAAAAAVSSSCSPSVPMISSLDPTGSSSATTTATTTAAAVVARNTETETVPTAELSSPQQDAIASLPLPASMGEDEEDYDGEEEAAEEEETSMREEGEEKQRRTIDEQNRQRRPLAETTSLQPVAAAKPFDLLQHPPLPLPPRKPSGKGKKASLGGRGKATATIEDPSETTRAPPAASKKYTRRKDYKRKGSIAGGSGAGAGGPKTARRASSKISLLQQQQGRRILPVADDFPHRLVQPLVHSLPPPTASAAAATISSASALAPAAGSSGSAAATKSSKSAAATKTGGTAKAATVVVESGSSSPSTSHAHQVRAQDIWPLLDIYLPHPDTFSIAYYARLLGIHPSTAASSSSPPPPPLTAPPPTPPPVVTPFSFASSLHSAAGLERPAASLLTTQGTWASRRFMLHTGKRDASNQDAPDDCELDLNLLDDDDRDPLYVSLLSRFVSSSSSAPEGGEEEAITTPVTPAQQSRLVSRTLSNGLLLETWKHELQTIGAFRAISPLVASLEASRRPGSPVSDENDEVELTCRVKSVDRSTVPGLTQPSLMVTTGSENACKPSRATSHPICKLMLSKYYRAPVSHIGASKATTVSTTMVTSKGSPSNRMSVEVSGTSPVTAAAAIQEMEPTTAASALNYPTKSDSSASPVRFSSPTSEEGTTFGYAYYGFEWYPLQHDFELVLVIHDIQKADSTSLLLQSHESGDEKNNTLDQAQEVLLLLLITLVLEHARRSHVWYALVSVPVGPLPSLLARYFRMTAAKESSSFRNTSDARNDSTANQEAHDTDTATNVSSNKVPRMVHMVCDIHKCSARYAFLRYKENLEQPQQKAEASNILSPPSTHRWLARLPNVDEVQAALKSSTPSDRTSSVAVRASNKKGPMRKPSFFFTGAAASAKQTVVGFRARRRLPPEGGQRKGNEQEKELTAVGQLQQQGEGQIVKQESNNVLAETMGCTFAFNTLNCETGAEGSCLPPVSETWQALAHVHLDLMRDFELSQSPPAGMTLGTQLAKEIAKKYQELGSMEMGLHAKLKNLMSKVLDERLLFEHTEEPTKRLQEEIILKEYRHKVELRKEVDLLREQQRQLDMEAVCDICNDGEVTPDNQILFCEACNVAVHQMCYGVDRIPEGDYYCIACRHLGRCKSYSATVLPEPLPITCELCPRKEGAFIRTKTKSKIVEQEGLGKWVHMVCAKWQGLNLEGKDAVEDVTELKIGFRRLGVRCHLCQGERGGMIQCRFPGCDAWMHVTCARAVGTCNVIHGEDVNGEETINPWTLNCPDHSDIKPDDIPKDSLTVDDLIKLAQQCPPEPLPPPEPIAPKPFNTATGKERRLLLQNKAYERELLEELIVKKIFGARCEVCDEEMDAKVRTRCNMCGVIFCDSCKLQGEGSDGNFKCASCLFVQEKERKGQAFETPQCIACYQRDGLLRRAKARPISRKSYWHQNRKVYEKSMFGKPIWAHTLCTL